MSKRIKGDVFCPICKNAIAYSDEIEEGDVLCCPDCGEEELTIREELVDDERRLVAFDRFDLSAFDEREEPFNEDDYNNSALIGTLREES